VVSFQNARTSFGKFSFSLRKLKSFWDSLHKKNQYAMGNVKNNLNIIGKINQFSDHSPQT